ncbi:cellulose binding domain-containing protein [Micromonospora yangpuensis]|uniref:GDSL-like Lipase/Acylhydrolase family protein n=1 Tax=Micromonospora yangpuensis TaxID=683228 RepID=A0A1C6UN04_9ACTN|nr:cellulose binding domain-containing protein [Micromonospora yangpuensis]GGM28194.1 SGNH hydrolase [Micromonospora yangpuensis]SCL55387.1 GDSL-like Lipase/Acylhydrolase family protein [Micromonospora yangpuensis]
MSRAGSRWSVAATVATVVAAALAFAIGPANAEADTGVRVMPLGDSITDGFNVPGGYRIELWRRLVAGGHQVDFVGSLVNGPSSLGDRNHEGHSGWTIAQIDANVVNWLRTTTPRTVLLHIGTNDMYGDTSGAPARLSALIDKITATAPAADVFVATIVPRSGADNQVRAFNAAIPGIVQSKVNAGRKVHLVDMYNALTLADLADGVHPNLGGYDKMAAVWHNALRVVPGSIGGTTPPTTPPPTPPKSTPPPTTPPSAGACRVGYAVNAWNSGLTAEVTVTNTGATAVNGWALAFTLPAGQSVSSGWNATIAPTSGAVTARNVSYNAALAPGASVSFGFQATHTGNTARPSAFALNGSTCTTS